MSEEFKLVSPITDQSPVIDDPLAVAEQLRKLHQDPLFEVLKDAITAGLGARNESTLASAKTAAGVQQWLKTVEVLRTRLAALGWHIHDERNCPFISSSDRSISLVVMTGNKETGKKGGGDPSNQAEKGTVAEGYIGKNRQLELFNDQSLGFIENYRKETRVLVLLYHYDKALNEVRYELSYPKDFNKGKIVAWGLRIILGSLSNKPAFPTQRNNTAPDIVVDVEPKTGKI